MIRIEKTTEQGYEINDYDIDNALIQLSNSLDNGQMLFVNGVAFMKDAITKEDLKDGMEVVVTNHLGGG